MSKRAEWGLWQIGAISEGHQSFFSSYLLPCDNNSLLIKVAKFDFLLKVQILCFMPNLLTFSFCRQLIQVLLLGFKYSTDPPKPCLFSRLGPSTPNLLLSGLKKIYKWKFKKKKKQKNKTNTSQGESNGKAARGTEWWGINLIFFSVRGLCLHKNQFAPFSVYSSLQFSVHNLNQLERYPHHSLLTLGIWL